MKWRINVLALLFLAIFINAKGAEPLVNFHDGGVFRIKHAYFSEQDLSFSGENAYTVTYKADDLTQQWYVKGDDENGYSLQNLYTGAYLTSVDNSDTAWPLTYIETPTDLMKFKTGTVTAKEGPYMGQTVQTLRQKDKTDNISNNAYASARNHGIIFRWVGDAGGSYWLLEEVKYTEDELQKLIDEMNAVAFAKRNLSETQTRLDALFADKACTELKRTVDFTTDADYLALPPALQEMVRKIQNKNWDETCTYKDRVEQWDGKYAQKYRIQQYEAYSEGNVALDLIKIQPYTNMNNPTGILGDKNDFIYVMVKEDIPEGANLYIQEVPDENMYNSVTGGTRLHKGLNLVLCNNNNSHYFIYYTVATSSNGKPVPERKLSNYPPLTIHIEGGRLNGFFNHIGDKLYEKDTEEDFKYTAMRATHPMYDFVGKYVILHLHLEDTKSHPTDATPQRCVKTSMITDRATGADRVFDPVKIMEAWDHMCLSERVLMGITTDEETNDSYNLGYYESNVETTPVTFTYGSTVYTLTPDFHYSDYFNSKMMGISMPGDLFMNATYYRTAYNVSTIESILTQFCKGDIWGPAHEYGHMNQGPMNMAGTTEESNNIFSNVATYYAGRTTSRCDFISTQMKIFEEGRPFLDHSTWGTTRMFWQLWCYYHATGHNKKFYPRLIELLRHNPLKHTTDPGKHMEINDKLHFVRMACIAAGEDLTNFFTAWGFFVPLYGYLIDDYSKYYAYLTEEEIKQVKEEIAGYGFKKNDAIILIDDRVHADPNRSSYGGFPKEKAGELGGLPDFRDNQKPSGNFSFTVDVTTVTVETTEDAGVGYLIWDAETGELLGFSNSNSFDVSPELAAKLVDGTARVDAVGADNTVQNVVNLVKDGSAAQKKETLKGLVDSANSYLKYVDETLTKVGFIIPAKAEPLEELCKEAENFMQSETATGEELTDIILRLTDEYNRLLADEDALIPIEEGAEYIIHNHYTDYSRYVLSTNGTVVIGEQVNKFDDSEPRRLWKFESADVDGRYYLVNVGTNKKAQKQDASNSYFPMGETGDWFELVKIRNLTENVGVFAFAAIGNQNRGAFQVNPNYSNKVIPWAVEAGSAKWYITQIHDADYVRLREEYNTLIEESRALLESSGEFTDRPKTTMSFATTPADNCDLYSNAPYKASNNGDNFVTWNVLFDDNPDTYFHSDYSGQNSADGYDHYIRLKAPEEGEYRYFTLSYVTRNSDSGSAKISAVTIEGSADGSNWQKLYNVTSGLNTTKAALNTLPEIKAPEGTKYIRFVVNKSGGAAGGHAFFAISGLKVEHRDFPYDCRPYEKYNHLDASEMEEFLKAIIQAEYLRDHASQTLESLRDNINALRRAKVYYEAQLSLQQIAYLYHGTVNDANDTNIEENVVRQTFNPHGNHKIENFIMIGNTLDSNGYPTHDDSLPELPIQDIYVEITPVGIETWAVTDAVDDNIDEEYEKAFRETAPESTLYEQYKGVNAEKTDGFFTSASARLETGDTDIQGNGICHLVLDVPCSGIYRVTFINRNEEFLLVDTEHDVPYLDIEIYPNLHSVFDIDRGFNIEGYSFPAENKDGELYKTISLPSELTSQKDLRRCVAYIPGLYFVDEFEITAEPTTATGRNYIPDRREGKRLADGDESESSGTTGADASKYYSIVDLSYLNTVSNPAMKLNVSVKKNGATSNYIFLVNTGENDNVSTGIDAFETGDDYTIYYNLNGVPVSNPGPGIYIRVEGNKVEKVVI